ncbi:MAG: hypothetical protein ACRCTE_09005 [Cellulosilyticaceae bacterium]
MSITSALVLFVVFIIVYVIIAEIFTVLFRLTGLTEEKARFQVISMLTNSGYTTSESELITSASRRRKLARLTMLFGYSFTVTIVSIIVNIFIALTKSEVAGFLGIAGVILTLFLVFYILTRFVGIKKAFDRKIEHLGNKVMFGDRSNPIVILDTYGDHVMAQINLTHLPYFLQEVPLHQSRLKEDYHVQVMLLKRQGQDVTMVDGHTIMKTGDDIVVFGGYKHIRDLFEKPTT